MSLYDKHPLPWQAFLRDGDDTEYDWMVRDARGVPLAFHMNEPVAKWLAGAPLVLDAAESLLLDADRSDEAPEVSMVPTVSLQRLRETLEQVEERGAP